MSRGAKTPVRANAGDTTEVALKAIRQLEAEQVDWDAQTLATRCDISVQHARNIIVRLSYHGTLQYADGVVVKKRRLVLTDVVPAKSSSRAA